jgi:hypothetical protein
MKRCATCNRTYEDSSLNYCLADGAPLVEMASEPTLVIPGPATKKKSKLLVWLALGVLVIGLVVTVFAVLLLYKFSGTNNGGTNNQTNRQVSSASPKPKLSPSPTSVPEDTNKDQSVEPDTTPSIEGPEETTPILWDTTASGFKGSPGTTYKFQCPDNGIARPIFGSDIYTDYSSICTAAVHAGVLTLKDGGIITMEYRPGRSIYGSTVRHDVTSITTGEHTRSFIIRPNGKD